MVITNHHAHTAPLAQTYKTRGEHMCINFTSSVSHKWSEHLMSFSVLPQIQEPI